MGLAPFKVYSCLKGVLPCHSYVFGVKLYVAVKLLQSAEVEGVLSVGFLKSHLRDSPK